VDFLYVLVRAQLGGDPCFVPLDGGDDTSAPVSFDSAPATAARGDRPPLSSAA
jgi:hypothetical protein